MRKQVKKIIALVMSAALAITAGAGINLTKSSAADTKPSFVAGLTSFGTFAGWVDSVPSDTVQVTDFGEYTLTGEATTDLDDLFKSENATAVVLGKDKADKTATLAEMTEAGLGTTFDVVGKSIQINDGDIISWNVTPVTDWDSQARMVIDNAWNPDKDFKTDVVAPIKKGDKIKVTFEVKAKDGSSDASTPGAITTPGAVETPAPAGAPTEAALKATGHITCSADGWDSNGNSTYEDATVAGAGKYTVTKTFEEDVEVGDYMAVRFEALDSIAPYVTFKDVTVWVDGKVTNIVPTYGGDGDCRIEITNNWGKTPTPADLDGVEFSQIKVQFTIGIQSTERVYSKDGNENMNIVTDPSIVSDYDYNKPTPAPADPTPAPADPTPAPTTPSTKNSVKTLKAAKKSVNVKKGKKANVTVKVTANNNKKKTTDKVTATSSNKKVAKVVKTTVKAGKIVVSVKGVKKGTAKITVKAAKKKAVVTVKVK